MKMDTAVEQKPSVRRKNLTPDGLYTVYVGFFATDFKTGRIIRTVTRHMYNHVAISLDSMRSFYSFSRLYIDHMMIAGFVAESPRRYLMSGKIMMRVYRLELDRERYEKIEHRIDHILRKSNKYVYNHLSCLAYLIGKRFVRKHAFTCAEFVRDTLAMSGVLPPREGKKVSIRRLEEELEDFGCEMIEGRAEDILKNSSWGSDRYLMYEGGRVAAFKEASKRFVKLVKK